MKQKPDFSKINMPAMDDDDEVDFEVERPSRGGGRIGRAKTKARRIALSDIWWALMPLSVIFLAVFLLWKYPAGVSTHEKLSEDEINTGQKKPVVVSSPRRRATTQPTPAKTRLEYDAGWESK